MPFTSCRFIWWLGKSGPRNNVNTNADSSSNSNNQGSSKGTSGDENGSSNIGAKGDNTGAGGAGGAGGRARNPGRGEGQALPIPDDAGDDISDDCKRNLVILILLLYIKRLSPRCNVFWLFWL